MGPNDKSRVEFIRFLKASFHSEHVVFLHASPLITVYSHIFSILKHSTVVATYFNETQQYIIWVTYDCMHRTVAKKKKKKLNVTSLGNIIIITIYWPDSNNNKYNFTFGENIHLSNVNKVVLCLSYSESFKHLFVLNPWKKLI